MSTAWVAGSVRARALASAALTATPAEGISRERTAPAAVSVLMRSPYGRHLAATDDLASAQHAVAGTLLWRLRVLAGWVPRQGAQLIRAFSAGFEVANVHEHMAALDGRPTGPLYELGTLETAWRRLAATRSLEELRLALTASAWGDPGTSDEPGIRTAMTLAWADRLTTLPVRAAREWAQAGAATVVLRECLLLHRRLEGAARTRTLRVLGPRVVVALDRPSPTLGEVTDQLPSPIRPLWDGVTDGKGLWRAEAAWRRRVGEDGLSLLRRAGQGPDTIVGAVGVLATDAWRTQAALEVAARGKASGDRPPAAVGLFEDEVLR